MMPIYTVDFTEKVGWTAEIEGKSIEDVRHHLAENGIFDMGFQVASECDRSEFRIHRSKITRSKGDN